jgi:hypothetical protein
MLPGLMVPVNILEGFLGGGCEGQNI